MLRWWFKPPKVNDPKENEHHRALFGVGRANWKLEPQRAQRAQRETQRGIHQDAMNAKVFHCEASAVPF
jgi:hypothetical protein